MFKNIVSYVLAVIIEVSKSILRLFCHHLKFQDFWNQDENGDKHQFLKKILNISVNYVIRSFPKIDLSVHAFSCYLLHSQDSIFQCDIAYFMIKGILKGATFNWILFLFLFCLNNCFLKSKSIWSSKAQNKTCCTNISTWQEVYNNEYVFFAMQSRISSVIFSVKR